MLVKAEDNFLHYFTKKLIIFDTDGTKITSTDNLFHYSYYK